MHLYLGLDGVNVDQRVLTPFYVFIYVFIIGEAYLAVWRRVGDDSLQLERISLYNSF